MIISYDQDKCNAMDPDVSPDSNFLEKSQIVFSLFDFFSRPAPPATLHTSELVPAMFGLETLTLSLVGLYEFNVIKISQNAGNISRNLQQSHTVTLIIFLLIFYSRGLKLNRRVHFPLQQSEQSLHTASHLFRDDSSNYRVKIRIINPIVIILVL